jgi:hypothetical protein
MTARDRHSYPRSPNIRCPSRNVRKSQARGNEELKNSWNSPIFCGKGRHAYYSLTRISSTSTGKRGAMRLSALKMDGKTKNRVGCR